jgi:hypothetical protein
MNHFVVTFVGEVIVGCIRLAVIWLVIGMTLFSGIKQILV